MVGSYKHVDLALLVNFLLNFAFLVVLVEKVDRIDWHAMAVNCHLCAHFVKMH